MLTKQIIREYEYAAKMLLKFIWYKKKQTEYPPKQAIKRSNHNNCIMFI